MGRIVVKRVKIHNLFNKWSLKDLKKRKRQLEVKERKLRKQMKVSTDQRKRFDLGIRMRRAKRELSKTKAAIEAKS